VCVERLEHERGAGPAGPRVEQLRTREAEQHDRCVLAPGRDVLEQVEERRRGPVHVFEPDEQRPLARKRLEQAPNCPHRLLRGRARVLEPVRDEIPVGLARNARPDGIATAGRAHEVAERQERDAVAVGDAPGGEHAHALAGLRSELGGEARLADAGVAVDRDDAAGAFAHRGVELGREERELFDAADQRRVEPAGERAGARNRCEHTPRADRLRLPFRLDRIRRLEQHRVLDEQARRLADQDLVRPRGLFEPLRRVDGVAGHERLRARTCDDLAARDADADAERRPAFCGELVVQVLELLAHLDRRLHRAQGVVLVDVRHAEDGHDRVADEFLYRAAVTLDRHAHRVVPASEDVSERLRVECFPERRRPDEVAEEDRDRLASGGGAGHPDSVARIEPRGQAPGFSVPASRPASRCPSGRRSTSAPRGSRSPWRASAA
jgi:hypothetical protein